MTDYESDDLREATTGSGSDRAWVCYLPGFLRKRFEKRHVFQEAVENSGWLIADKVLRMGIGLVME